MQPGRVENVIKNEMFEGIEVDFEEIMNHEEVLSDDTGYASDSSKHDTDHAEKFVPSSEIRALNTILNTA